MILFLYGQDSFRSRRKLNEVKEKFLREVDPSGNSLNMVDGETATIGKINESAGAGTLFARKRMVVIENLFSNKSQNIFEAVYEYFKNKKSDDNIVIFWDNLVKLKKGKVKEEAIKLDSSGREKKLSGGALKLFNFLAKQKFAQQFSSLSNTEASLWIKKEVEARDGKISSQAAQLLSAFAGGDLWQADNEIGKLLNYIKTGEIIEPADIELLAKGKFDENIFALTDAISNKNAAAAVKLLEEQKEAGLADSYLLAMIIRQIKILLQIRQALDSGDSPRKIMSALKLHPFVAQKGMGQARRFTLPALKNILNELVKIDFNMKSGRADAKTGLSLMIARM